MQRAVVPVSLVLLTVLLLAGSPASAQDAAAPPIPMPERWDTTYVLMLEVNADYAPPSDSAAASVLMAHIQYQLGLVASARARQGGPIADAMPTEIVGMTILATRSRAEAEAIAEADPAVKAGRLRVKVRTWTTPPSM